ncbi:hypothetical protein E2C01_017282 [Portunus trituberculatus]|uniref:Uncharacterized protein n=1 Tax=Portunus trituberculatus TaxID=210409 RepID=A0A5B7DTC2_PORTR|nr:hypothetical protein [Portunus trituberculatus]
MSSLDLIVFGWRHALPVCRDFISDAVGKFITKNASRHVISSSVAADHITETLLSRIILL